jgi:hypothetical protein
MASIGVAQYALAAGLAALDLAARAWRIMVLVPMPFLTAFATNAAGDTLAAVTPSRVGADPIRFARFIRAGLPAAPVLAASPLR